MSEVPLEGLEGGGGATQGVTHRASSVRRTDGSCRLLIVPLFRGSSRFERLILSHHSRHKDTCEGNEEDSNDDYDATTQLVQSLKDAKVAHLYLVSAQGADPAYTHIYIYLYIYVYVYKYIYVYIHIDR